MKEYIIIDDVGKKRKAVKVRCTNCGYQFLKAKRFLKEDGNNYCNHNCSAVHRRKRVKVNCDLCGKVFERQISKSQSKSGFLFCSRKCKDSAQELGGKFKKMLPPHYSNEISIHTYRSKALNYYGFKCEICGYDEHLEILQVHHIDENRKNNDIENLIVMCPNHHWAVHMGVLNLERSKHGKIIEISLNPMEASSLARRLILNVNMMKEVDMIFETPNKECIIIQTVKETE
jgi:predicted restriction endonuclease